MVAEWQDQKWLRRTEVQNLERIREWNWWFCSQHDRQKWGEQLVSFQELTARRDKVKTSLGSKPRGCKEKKVYELQIQVTPEGVLDPVDEHVRNKKKFKVCVYPYFTMIMCAYLVLQSGRLSSTLSFFILAATYRCRVNKPLCNLKEFLRSSTYYHSKVTTRV